MKYIIIGGITIIVTLLISKVYTVVNLMYFNKYPKEKIETVQKKSTDTQILKTGKNLYMVYCTSCHGQDGKGNNEKAHNHTKRISRKSVSHAIKNGANNFISLYPSGMPSHLINKNKIEEVAKYVSKGLKGEKPKIWNKCASCHGENGEGIAYIAPNIKSYTDDLVMTVLLNGKKGAIGTMPNFKDRLTTVQMKSIAMYIRSLGESK
jgi:cytochrome c oxidase cbb3-type subunit 3